MGLPQQAVVALALVSHVPLGCIVVHNGGGAASAQVIVMSSPSGVAPVQLDVNVEADQHVVSVVRCLRLEVSIALIEFTLFYFTYTSSVLSAVLVQPRVLHHLNTGLVLCLHVLLDMR